MAATSSLPRIQVGLEYLPDNYLKPIIIGCTGISRTCLDFWSLKKFITMLSKARESRSEKQIIIDTVTSLESFVRNANCTTVAGISISNSNSNDW